MTSMIQSTLDSLKGKTPYIAGGAALLVAALMLKSWASPKRRRY